MAAKQIDELIDNTLNDKQKDALFELQSGMPEFLTDDKVIEVLDEYDLVNRIQYTSVRSNEAVMGWALSERGNQVVEEIKRRNERKEVEDRLDANSQKAEAEKKDTKKNDSNS